LQQNAYVQVIVCIYVMSVGILDNNILIFDTDLVLNVFVIIAAFKSLCLLCGTLF